MPLLPDQTSPTLRQIGAIPDVRRMAALDAVCAIVGPDLAPGALARAGHAATFLRLLARTHPASGAHVTATLPNERQTLVVIGVLPAGAERFAALALAGRMLKEIQERAPQNVLICTSLPAAQAGTALEALASAALAQAFRLPATRSRPKRAPALRRIDVLGATDLPLARVQVTAAAGNLARWLTALPPNQLDARGYRRLLAQLARNAGARLRWYDEAALRRKGAGAFLAVAAGNARRDAGIAHLSWRPPGRRSRRSVDLALVGKGILFDTGGTNLKPHRGMLDMHTDMAGSAVALASLLALARLRVPLALDCWLAVTENSIGPSAYRPQDIVTAANGVTIQVIHTDAEGRMALADTLALAAREEPGLILDFATLTGACVNALTERMSGVFTNRDALRETLHAAGTASGERVLAFPMPADYDSEIESRVADVAQCAVDGKGDHILAARFLRRFVPESTPWVHVDLSSATRSGGLGHVSSDITGFGVRFTVELVLGQAVLERAGASGARGRGAGSSRGARQAGAA